MKLYKISFALMLGIGVLASCSDKLDVTNPNNQTTGSFGYTAADLEESVIAMYNHIRMEGTYARVGYGIDVMRGDEVWNCSQQWWLPYDNLNTPITDEIGQWIWRDWYYTLNVANFIISRTQGDNLTEQLQRIKGQALFIRGLVYYNLVGYFQNPAIITDYNAYSTLDGLYASNVEDGDADASAQYDRVFDQIEADLSAAMTLLPSRDEGGQWATGRATSGAAAGFYARALMMRHKYSEALAVLKDIMSTADGGNQKYGAYKLMANYGDNFREGSAYENNDESLFEIQFLDYGSQGTDDEWTPVNTSPNATQGSAIESICGGNAQPYDVGGWADLAVSPWLYNLFKAERTTSNSLDPRLYWTVGTYESEWEGFENGNVYYANNIAVTDNPVVNSGHGGLPVAKFTNLRTNLYDKVVTGLHDGINLRMMRYSDVLLRAAECENEVNGPTANAFKWIDAVRTRAGLAPLDQTRFNTADKLFEQIANVERPKEFGCEFGRGFDLIRWGFFYDSDRLQQLKEHGAFYDNPDPAIAKNAVPYANKGNDSSIKSSFDTYAPGHEFVPLYQNTLNDNPNLKGNSANLNTDNATYFRSKGWTVRPVVNL